MVEATPQNVRWLKLAVIVLGVVLAGGAATVVVTILHRLGAASPTLARFDVRLPGHAEVLESSTDNGRLLLRLRTDEGEEIRIFELATGREIARIKLERGS